MMSWKMRSLACVVLMSSSFVMAALEPVYADVTANTGAAYVAECQSKGVPLPPGWGSASWVFNGSMGPGTTPPIENFIVKPRPALVYYAQLPQGLCMTLPRPYLPNAVPGPNTVPRAGFGVICQGSNGNVCFWDNATPVPWHDSNGATVLSPPVVIASTSPADLDGTFIGGASLLPPHPGGMCTDCHAGKNPFIVMPSRPTKLPVNQTTQVRYNPIVPAGWLQGSSPDRALDAVSPAPMEGSCLSCHTDAGQAGGLPPMSPKASPGFCVNVLKSTRDLNEMPPTALSMRRHWDTLSTVCNELATFTSAIEPAFASGASAQPRESFNVTMRLKNEGPSLGSVPWTGQHSLVVVQSPAAPVWNAFPVSVGTVAAPVARGSSVTVILQVTAPLNTGTFPLQVGVLAPTPSGPVRIGLSDPVAVTVASNYNATITFTSVPGSLQSGASGIVSVAIKNEGPGAWSAGPSFALQLARTGRLALPVNALNLPRAVPPGDTIALSFTVMCNSQGLGGLTVQMGGPGGAFPASSGRNIVCQ